MEEGQKTKRAMVVRRRRRSRVRVKRERKEMRVGGEKGWCERESAVK